MGRAGVRNRKKRSSLSSSFSRDGRTDGRTSTSFLPRGERLFVNENYRCVSHSAAAVAFSALRSPSLCYTLFHSRSLHTGISLALSSSYSAITAVRTQSGRTLLIKSREQTSGNSFHNERASERASRDPNSVPRTRSKKCRGRGVPKTRDGQQPQ